MKKSWRDPAQNRVQASSDSFVPNQNIFSVLTVRGAWRFGATKTLPYVIYVKRKYADQKTCSHVLTGANMQTNAVQ